MRVLNTLGKILGFTHDPLTEKRLHPIQQKLEYLLSDINLESDSTIRNKIEEDPDRWIDVVEILKFEDFKKNQVTDTEIIHCAESSRVLEADPERNRIRTMKPFKEDPERLNRCIRVSGLNSDATLDLQREFFESLFSSVENVFLQNKRTEDGLVYTGTTIVELGSAEEAKEAAEKGIAYDDGVLDVVVMSDYKEKLKETKEKTPKRSPRKP